MTRRSFRELEREIDNMRTGGDDGDDLGPVLGFEAPDGDGLLDEDGEPIEDTSRVMFRISHDIWGEWENLEHGNLSYPGADDPEDDPDSSGEDTDTDSEQ